MIVGTPAVTPNARYRPDRFSLSECMISSDDECVE